MRIPWEGGFFARRGLLDGRLWRSQKTVPEHSVAPGIGTEFPANRGKIEVTRHDSTYELSPVPVGRAHRPHMRAISACKRISPGDRDSLAERSGFELPVPLGFIWSEFGPSKAHYSARIKASMLERICSPVVRLYFGSFRFPSFGRLILGIR